MRRSLLVVAAAVGAVVFAALALPASAGTAPLPGSMAATGDSISQAFNVDQTLAGRDNPQLAWSTGTDPAVNSHYRRILAANPTIGGHAYNYAVSGSKMVDLDGQLKRAASQKVDYVTVLTGANDLCAATIAGMTPVAAFEAQSQRAMANFASAHPHGRIFVSSIPNLHQMWSVLQDNSTAVATWQHFRVCQSMLNPGNTEADRQQVLARERAYNDVLASVCAKYDQCRWDGYALFNTNLTASDIGTVDYFHPSISGQGKLASVSWQAGYWSTEA